MEYNKEMNFAASVRLTASLKEAVNQYVSGSEINIILADYHVDYGSFLTEGQREAFAEELKSLHRSQDSLLEAASRTTALIADGNTDEARRSLEIFDLRADNQLLQLELAAIRIKDVAAPADIPARSHYSELTRGIENINARYQEHTENAAKEKLDNAVVYPQPAVDDNGDIIVMSEITDRKAAYDALRASEERFRLLAGSIPQFIWTLSTEGKLEYFNDSLVKYSGHTPEELLGGAFPKMVHEDDLPTNKQLWEHSFATGEEFIIEHRMRRHDGEYRWHLCRALAQKNDKGEILQWVGTSNDIHDQKTFQKRLETLVEERTNELKKANHELENMNKELSSFAYISSHDLQEPLRKIHTFGSIIMANEFENLSEAGKRNFSRMQLAADRMTKLIQDLLSYSRSNAGEKTFEQTNLNTLLEEVRTDFADTLADKNSTLIIGELPTINAIPFQIRQLFNNLVSNALKFSKEDSDPVITITAQEVLGAAIDNPNTNTNKKYLHVAVTDNGIGFSPEYASRIFEVFQRLHGKGEYEGTGIGLAICMKIAENHQAILNASSKPGEGATFNIYFPLN